MGGIAALSKVQLSIESTAGSPHAATTLWRGKGKIKDNRNLVLVDEQIGYLSGVTRGYFPKLGAGITLSETPATFEQLPYLLTCGIEALTTGVADSTGSGKVYTYALATTAVKTPSTLTVEAGDNQEAEVMEYAFVDSFKLAGKAGEAWMMSADLIGRQAAVQAFTAGQTAPIVEEILFGKSTLYIDAISGTAGTTVKASTLMGAELSVKSGFQPVFAANGQLYFDFIKQTSPEVKLTVTFEHDGSAAAQKVLWRAGTPVQVQTKTVGAALTTAGNYAAKTLKITLAGLWDSFSVIDEIDQNDVVTGTIIGRYDITNSKAPLQVIVVNNLAALP